MSKKFKKHVINGEDWVKVPLYVAAECVDLKISLKRLTPLSFGAPSWVRAAWILTQDESYSFRDFTAFRELVERIRNDIDKQQILCVEAHYAEKQK